MTLNLLKCSGTYFNSKPIALCGERYTMSEWQVSSVAFYKRPSLSTFNVPKQLLIWALFAEGWGVISPNMIMPMSIHGFGYHNFGLCTTADSAPFSLFSLLIVSCSRESAHLCLWFKMILLSLPFPFISRHLISGSCFLISSETSFVFVCLAQRCLPEHSKSFQWQC